MTKQDLARRCNMLKMRILGFNIQSYRNVLTDIEIERVKQIGHLLQDMLISWDSCSKELGFTPRKSKRCRICSMKGVLVDGVCRECERVIIENI